MSRDTQILDALERFIWERGGIMLWTGEANEIPTSRSTGGISLISGKRSLREALDGLIDRRIGDRAPTVERTQSDVSPQPTEANAVPAIQEEKQ